LATGKNKILQKLYGYFLQSKLDQINHAIETGKTFYFV